MEQLDSINHLVLGDLWSDSQDKLITVGYQGEKKSQGKWKEYQNVDDSEVFLESMADKLHSPLCKIKQL